VSGRDDALVEERYWVFARAERGAALAQIGVVKAATPTLAVIYARQNYTERHWDELLVAPERAFFAAEAGQERHREAWLGQDSR
jgi:1,2-phenylacetyl-CoA epoxidase PaaB subunit